MLLPANNWKVNHIDTLFPITLSSPLKQKSQQIVIEILEHDIVIAKTISLEQNVKGYSKKNHYLPTPVLDFKLLKKCCSMHFGKVMDDMPSLKPSQKEMMVIETLLQRAEKKTLKTNNH